MSNFVHAFYQQSIFINKAKISRAFANFSREHDILRMIINERF